MMCPDTRRIHQLICDIKNAADEIEDEKLRLKLIEITEQATDAIYNMVDNMECEG